MPRHSLQGKNHTCDMFLKLHVVQSNVCVTFVDLLTWKSLVTAPHSTGVQIESNCQAGELKHFSLT